MGRSPGLQSTLLANARSLLAFRPAHKDANTITAVLGGDVSPDQLERLGAFHACVRLLVDSHPTEPFAIRTTPPAMRQQINQGFFRKIDIGEGGTFARVDFTKPFARLLPQAS